MLLLGTLLNVAGILLGGIVTLARRRQLQPKTQVALKGLLGVATVFVGLSTTWQSLGGGVGGVVKGMTIIVLALILGRLTGRLLHIQAALNKLGQHASEKFTKAVPGQSQPWSEGFTICALLFCITPLALIGPLLDGLGGHWQTLAIKAVMDGLATMAFVQVFGWSTLASIVPVIAFQGTVTMAAKLLAPHLVNPAVVQAIQGTAGMIVFCVSLIILELKKVELGDYLPALAWAPLLAWVWK
jgi:uncharacterized membrane protein YqgA involved in biofilm formation